MVKKQSVITHLGAVALGLIVGYQIPALVNTYQRNQDIRQVEKQIEQNPNDPTNWVSLGTFKQIAGDDKGALEAYKKALELDAQSLLTYRQIGSLYLERGDQILAEKWFQDALDLAKKHYPDEVYESERFLEFVLKKRKIPGNPTMPSTGPQTRWRGSSAG